MIVKEPDVSLNEYKGAHKIVVTGQFSRVEAVQLPKNGDIAIRTSKTGMPYWECVVRESRIYSPD